MHYNQLDFNPDKDFNGSLADQRPWVYIGDEAAVAPFIVRVYITSMRGMLDGEGGYHYFFWFFGYKLHVKTDLHWLS